MNIALTGATRYIGSHILTELLSHGHAVTALVRDDTQSSRPSPPEVLRRSSSTSTTWAAVVKACSATPMVRSTPPARVTRPAPTSTPLWWTPRSTRFPVMGKPYAADQRRVGLRFEHRLISETSP